MCEAEFAFKGTNGLDLSIVIPTYNERANIAKLLDALKRVLPGNILYEIIIVDDNSPDGTGQIIEKYINSEAYKLEGCVLKVIHRDNRSGLISALLTGIERSAGRYILVMDADFSHPPEIIPAILDEFKHDPSCVVVASRYVAGGSIKGWPYKRRLISTFAAQIARCCLKLRRVKDPISGFFAFPRSLTQKISFETDGYKLLLELLVKTRNEITIKEIPYSFSNRAYGTSKLDLHVIRDYIRAIWILYKYGRRSSKSSVQPITQRRNSQLFISKAGRFFTVGASGLLVNYFVSYLLFNGIVSDLWYIHATMIGIAVSITYNFLLNKIWTFEDTDYSIIHTLKQYGLYVILTSLGAFLQLSLIYVLVEWTNLSYGISLFLAVAFASMSNFLTNKKWTFKEKVWG